MRGMYASRVLLCLLVCRENQNCGGLLGRPVPRRAHGIQRSPGQVVGLGWYSVDLYVYQAPGLGHDTSTMTGHSPKHVCSSATARS